MTRSVTDPIRVLYVEDDKSLQLTISQMLKMLGYEVACADNGQMGVEKALNWHPDVILMDVRMPLMNGDEAVRVLRQKSEMEKVPIFILSAYTDARTRNVCLEAGADKFFTKPADVRRLDAAIKEAVNHV